MESSLSKLKLYFKWGIKFEEEYCLPDKTARKVSYKERDELIRDAELKYPKNKLDDVDFEEKTKRKNIRTGVDAN